MQVNFNFSINIDDRYINFFRKVFTKRKAFLALLVAVVATNLNADTITKLHTFTAGNTIIADDVNDNFDQLFAKVNELEAIGASRMRVTKNNAQSMPAGTTIVQYDEKDFDNLGEYDNTTNHRFTAIEAGYYSVSASLMSEKLTWDAGVFWQLNISKNDVTYSTGERTYADDAVNDKYLTSQISDIVYLAANGYIDIRIYHSQESGAGICLGSVYNYFSVYRFR